MDHNLNTANTRIFPAIRQPEPKIWSRARRYDGKELGTVLETVDQPALGPPRPERGGDSLDIGADRLSGTCLDRFIHAVPGEIDAERGCGMCQGAFDTGVAPVLREKLTRFLLGAAGHHARSDEHQHWTRRGTSAQV